MTLGQEEIKNQTRAIPRVENFTPPDRDAAGQFEARSFCLMAGLSRFSIARNFTFTFTHFRGRSTPALPRQMSKEAIKSVHDHMMAIFGFRGDVIIQRTKLS